MDIAKQRMGRAYPHGGAPPLPPLPPLPANLAASRSSANLSGAMSLPDDAALRAMPDLPPNMRMRPPLGGPLGPLARMPMPLELQDFVHNMGQDAKDSHFVQEMHESFMVDDGHGHPRRVVTDTFLTPNMKDGKMDVLM